MPRNRNIKTDDALRMMKKIGTGGGGGAFYGVCSDAADEPAKKVSDVPNFELKEGVMIAVKFINQNSATSPTLNVNGTGDIPIYRYGTTAASTATTTTGWIAGAVQVFIYDGAGWIRDYWSNTTYSNVSLGQGYATCSTAAATVAKTASLSSYSLTANGVVSVRFTNDVPANATLNINSKGAKAIYYRNAKITDGIIKAGDTATFIYNTYYRLISIDRWQNDIDKLSNYVTPQMFGAKGDGTTDDTVAVQAALDNGGIVFFPSGRYKVTDELTATKPCKIVMERFYPSSYDGGDYPTTTAENEYGARIETYASGIGLLLGDCVEVDGLAIRAMYDSSTKAKFSGVILKYDGSQGIRTYPSQVRLQHIRVDVLNANVGAVESFFDFNPYRTYGVIVNDVVLGSNHVAQYGYYGFRCSLTNWATSIRLSNIIVDTHTHYPFYINSNGYIATNWVVQNLAIQTYHQNWLSGVIDKHITGAYFKDIEELLIIGSKMWDVNTSSFTDGVVKYVETGVDSKITAIGNDDYFNSIDTVGTKLNIASLTSQVTSNESTGGNTITLSDGIHEHKIEMPAVSLSDEQVGNAVGDWMVENAAPTPVVGRNKLSPDEAVNGGLNVNTGIEDGSISTYWCFPPFECAKGDVFRFIYNTGTATGLRNMYRTFEYDENMTLIKYSGTATSVYTITEANTKYFRAVISKSGNYGIPYENAHMCCVTINDTNTTWEAYKVDLVGGIGEYLVLASPNGTKYTLAVSDAGVVSATPV